MPFQRIVQFLLPDAKTHCSNSISKCDSLLNILSKITENIRFLLVLDIHFVFNVPKYKSI